MKVYVDGKAVRLDPRRAIGKGGEADVYSLSGGAALKLYKLPDHPDYALFPGQAQAARLRIEELQTKLPAFPSGLPGRVVRPEKLAYERGRKRILGYTMRRIDDAHPLVRLADRTFREQGGVTATAAVALLRDLDATVTALHRRGLVIGDFNDMNVLMSDLEGSPSAWIIDADSFQFGAYPCRLFTERFVDPLLCDPAAPALVLAAPHHPGSDAYAFAVMLVRSLLLTDPYGGVYKPSKGAPKVPMALRPLHRISVFHPQVRYPKPAYPREVLPDAWLDYFDRVFHRDERGAFPGRLFDELVFNRCPACGLEHSRRACPRCRRQLALVPPARAVRGRLERTVLLRVQGTVLIAADVGGRLLGLAHEEGAYRREDGRIVLVGDRDPLLETAVVGSTTVFARGSELVLLDEDGGARRLTVDSAGGRPSLATNGEDLFYVDDGRLLRDEPLGPQLVGEVLAGQTRFWVGDRFGFGYYRAGHLAVAFVFETHHTGLNDRVVLPSVPGTWLRTHATFAGDRCWFLITARDGGRIRHHVTVFGRDGRLQASAVAGDEAPWGAGLDGACAAGSYLLVATDDGIVRLGIAGPDVVETGSFPDTEPFVDTATRLRASPEGLLAVHGSTVERLVMK